MAGKLLDAVKRAFFDVGVFNFIAYYDENEELTAFLRSEGFACAQSDPVYSYPIVRALVSKKIARILEVGSDKNTMNYKELQPDTKQKVAAFLEQKYISSSMLDSGNFDEGFSFVYIKDGNIKGVLLAKEADPDIYINLLLTDETDALIASHLLAALAKAIKENVIYDGQFIMAVSNDQLRKSLESFFDEHLNVKTYSWSALLQV